MIKKHLLLASMQKAKNLASGEGTTLQFKIDGIALMVNYEGSVEDLKNEIQKGKHLHLTPDESTIQNYNLLIPCAIFVIENNKLWVSVVSSDGEDIKYIGYQYYSKQGDQLYFRKTRTQTQ